jgi:hypothetical protein
VTATQVGTATLAPISAVANINIVGEPIVVAKPTVMSKSISCIKGKTLKKVSGSNPKCPKGYKIKRIN